MYSLDRATGQRYWRAKTGPVGAPLALVDSTLLVPAQRGQLLGLNPADGSLRWRIRMGMARIAPVSVGRGAVVGRRAHERQAERNVDRMIERQRLDRDQRLVVIHA